MRRQNISKLFPNGIISLFILLSIGASSLLALEMRVVSEGRAVKLDDFDFDDDWTSLSPEGKRFITPYLIEYAYGRGKTEIFNNIVNEISAENEPYFKAYAVIADSYAKNLNSPDRVRLYKSSVPQNKDTEYKNILSHHIAMEVNSQRGSLRDQNIRSICNVRGRVDECDASALLIQVSGYASRQGLKKADYVEIMDKLKPFLDADHPNPAFSFLILEPLPELLVKLGLPMEAAIVAEKITRDYNHPSVFLLRSRIPFYLGAAGNFTSAIQYSEKYHNTDDPVLLNVRMDWMILSENYRTAIDTLDRVGPDHLGGERMKGMIDYWTGFPYSPGIVGIKLAMLLYLAGDIKNAGVSLDHLTNIPGNTPNGEPYKYYARLRMAQVFMEDNPELAHKIAEDISYTAQANNWSSLEYQATVLDGWAHYHSNDYYGAVVQFVKAGGIYSHLSEGSVNPYSRLLGIFAARRKLGKRGNYDRLIKEIDGVLEERPYNRAVYTITHWAPLSADRSFFFKEMVASQTARGKRRSTFDGIINRYKMEDSLYYRAGENPGGYDGLPTSRTWTREMKRFPYISTSGEGIRLPNFSPATERLILTMEKETLKQR